MPGIVPPIRVLDHTLLLIIPNRDRFGNPIDPRAVIEQLYDEICTHFTGLREWDERGVWINGQGKLIREENTVLKVSFQKDQEEEINHLVARYKDLAAYSLMQEAIAVELDGTLTLVPVKPMSNNSTDTE